VQQPDRVLTWAYLEPLVYQLCDALEYAHGEGIIHRDLKPANLMVDRAGRLKLADFGIARAVTDTMSRVSITQTSGTLLYMSPQQLDGAQPKATDDIYGIGTTLYELLTSKPPFYTGDLLQQARNAMPVSMRDRVREFKIANDIPAHVDEAVLACLSKIESRRPQPPRELARWLSTGQPPEKLQTAPKPKFAAALELLRELVGRKPVWIGTAVGLAAIALIWGIARRKPDTAAARPQPQPVVQPKAATPVARPEPAVAPSTRPKPSVQVSKITNPTPPPAAERKTNVQMAAATPAPAPAPISPPKPVAGAPEAPPPVATPPETPAPRPAPVATPPPAPKAITPAPAPVVRRQPTALELARTGNNHVSERSKNKIIEIVSDRMPVDTVTQQWRIVYYDPKATYKAVEVRFEGGEMVRVHEPTRLSGVFSTPKPLDFEKLKVESDQALRIALALPPVKELAVRSVELELDRGYAGAPVWNVRLFGNATPESTTETALGYAVIFADDGRVLKETFSKKVSKAK